MWDTRLKILAGIAVVLALASIFLLLRNRSLARKTSELEGRNQTLEARNNEALRRAKTLEDLLVAFDVSFSKSLRPETEPKLDELVGSLQDPDIIKEWETLRNQEAKKLTPTFFALRVRNLLIAVVTGIQEALGEGK